MALCLKSCLGKKGQRIDFFHQGDQLMFHKNLASRDAFVLKHSLYYSVNFTTETSSTSPPFFDKSVSQHSLLLETLCLMRLIQCLSGCVLKLFAARKVEAKCILGNEVGVIIAKVGILT